MIFDVVGRLKIAYSHRPWHRPHSHCRRFRFMSSAIDCLMYRSINRALLLLKATYMIFLH